MFIPKVSILDESQFDREGTGVEARTPPRKQWWEEVKWRVEIDCSTLST